MPDPAGFLRAKDYSGSLDFRLLLRMSTLIKIPTCYPITRDLVCVYHVYTCMLLTAEIIASKGKRRLFRFEAVLGF